MPANDTRGPEATRFTLLSHDLRAALSDVLGGLRLLSDLSMPPPERVQFDRVRTAGEELARLLEEGISFMPEDSPSGPIPLRLGASLRDTEMRWRGRAQEKGLRLTISLGPDLPQTILADRVALERVLSNLLANAIKFTPAGEVRLTVWCEAEGRLAFSVRDQGDGFAEAALAQLWQAYGRPEGARVEGTGLGLHICAQMARRMGAELEVLTHDAEHGGGAEVILHLPYLALEDTVAEPLPDLSGKRVLLAEDSQTNQAVLAQVLAGMGAQVELAGDGVAALTAFARSPFDLALIDIEMPRLSGIEVIRAIRQTRGAQLPIVAVTAYVLRANREAILGAGADAILPKPLDGATQLGAAIAAAMAARKPQVAPELSASAPPPTLPNPEQPQIPADLPRYDRARLAPLLAEVGPALACDLLEKIIADLTRVERGLVSGLASGDMAQLRAKTHILLSVAGTIRAARLATCAQMLNTLAHHPQAVGLQEIGRETLTEIDGVIALARREASLRAAEYLGERPMRYAEIERRAIGAALARHQGNVPATARELDLAPSTLYRKIKSWEQG